MEQQMKISNGPYLMGLAATHVLLAWETERPGNYTVYYDSKTGERKAIHFIDFFLDCANPQNSLLFSLPFVF
mgnify:CR=1 FL=1